jgi:hypothetical protein
MCRKVHTVTVAAEWYRHVKTVKSPIHEHLGCIDLSAHKSCSLALRMLLFSDDRGGNVLPVH